MSISLFKSHTTSAVNREHKDAVTPRATVYSQSCVHVCVLPVAMATMLDNLRETGEEVLTDFFVSSLDEIFAHPINDVQAALQPFSKEALAQLHKKLCSSAADLFPEFKDRRPVNRTAKHKLEQDIGWLGFSVCNGSPMRDLDKVFHPPSTSSSQQEPASTGENEGRRPQTPNEGEIAELLSVVASLTRRVSQLEKEVATMRAQSRGSEEATPTQEAMDTPLSSETEREEDGEPEADDFQPASSQSQRRKQRKRRKRENRERAREAENPSRTPGSPPRQPAARVNSSDAALHPPQAAPSGPTTLRPAPASTGLRAASTAAPPPGPCPCIDWPSCSWN